MVVYDKYWDWYISIRHTSEIIVLVSQLMISTAIKTYDVSPSSMPTARGFRIRYLMYDNICNMIYSII